MSKHPTFHRSTPRLVRLFDRLTKWSRGTETVFQSLWLNMSEKWVWRKIAETAMCRLLILALLYVLGNFFREPVRIIIDTLIVDGWWRRRETLLRSKGKSQLLSKEESFPRRFVSQCTRCCRCIAVRRLRIMEGLLFHDEHLRTMNDECLRFGGAVWLCLIFGYIATNNCNSGTGRGRCTLTHRTKWDEENKVRLDNQ